MQISSNYSGFNSNSVYKSVVTHHSQPEVVSASNSSTSSGNTPRSEEAESDQMQRDALKLQAAQRAAERTAIQLAKTQDL